MPLRQSIRWRSLEHGGLEQLSIYEWPEAYKVRSAIVGQAGQRRHGVLYEISLTPEWVFESIMLQRTDGVMTVLSRGKHGDWFDAQVEELPQLKGCIDVDFEMTPFTNTLPIRRAPLAIGESRRFRMAYIPADTMEPFADEQTYTRLSEFVYRFENGEGETYFTSDITVDADGLVVDYPGLFERV
jgi:hypothetical protein